MVEVVEYIDSGEPLTIRVIEPPLGTLAEVVEYWWADIRGPLLAGDLAATSRDRFFIGELAGQYVGSLAYATPRDTHDVAVLEMVWTHPDHRRKGIARRLLAHALADFRAGGGRAMYLCTTNPAAFALYQQAGFQPLIGDGLRYLAPGQADFDQTYFAPAGSAQVRPATWGDLARVTALYNQPAPAWLIKDYPRRVFRDQRYEGHYRQGWLAARAGRGYTLVLDNPLRRVVGIASAVEGDSYYEQHVLTFDCWACPAYLSQLPDLVAALVEQATTGATEVIQTWVAASDGERQSLLTRAGLREEARLPRRLRLGDERDDLLVYARALNRRRPSARPPSAYYGARPAFREAESPPTNRLPDAGAARRA